MNENKLKILKGHYHLKCFALQLNQTHFFCLIDINVKIRKIKCITYETINHEKWK